MLHVTDYMSASDPQGCGLSLARSLLLAGAGAWTLEEKRGAREGFAAGLGVSFEPEPAELFPPLSPVEAIKEEVDSSEERLAASGAEERDSEEPEAASDSGPPPPLAPAFVSRRRFRKRGKKTQKKRRA